MKKKCSGAVNDALEHPKLTSPCYFYIFARQKVLRKDGESVEGKLVICGPLTEDIHSVYAVTCVL